MPNARTTVSKITLISDKNPVSYFQVIFWNLHSSPCCTCRTRSHYCSKLAISRNTHNFLKNMRVVCKDLLPESFRSKCHSKVILMLRAADDRNPGVRKFKANISEVSSSCLHDWGPNDSSTSYLETFKHKQWKLCCYISLIRVNEKMYGFTATPHIPCFGHLSILFYSHSYEPTLPPRRIFVPFVVIAMVLPISRCCGTTRVRKIEQDYCSGSRWWWVATRCRGPIPFQVSGVWSPVSSFPWNGPYWSLLTSFQLHSCIEHKKI